MADEIKLGDAVQLKSGGPKMTVGRFEILNGVNNAVCGWFDGNERKVGTFPVTSLKPADQAVPGPAVAIVKPGFRP